MSIAEDQDREEGMNEIEPHAPLAEAEKLKSAIKSMAEKLLECEHLEKAASGFVYASKAALNDDAESDEIAEVLGAAYENLFQIGTYVEECLEIVRANGLDYWAHWQTSTEPSEDTAADISTTKAEARPEDTDQQVSHIQLQSRLERQQTAIASAVEKLSTTSIDLRQIASYFSTGMQALRSADPDVLRVLGDAYCRLLDGVFPSIRTVLDELDPVGAERRREVRKVSAS